MHSIIQGFVRPPGQFLLGYVRIVHTDKNEQLITVSRFDGSEQVQFKFPPNSAPFQAELIRAQGEGRDVAVVYAMKAGNYVIDFISLHVNDQQ